jgi:cation-transporting ATPase E
MSGISTVFKKPVQHARPNETGYSYWNILSTNLFSFFHIILFAVGIVLIAFGRYNDAVITVITALVSTFIRTFQEVRAKRQLDRIALLVRPVATVIRDGVEYTIDAATLVTGDLIHLCAGDQALVDGVVVGDGAAELDESLLTGESELVRKQLGDPISSGSFCVTGDLRYQAETVGAASFAHQLTARARTFTTSSTPLQQQVTLVIRLLMVLTVFMAAIFYIGGWLRDSSVLHYVAGSAVLIGLVPYGLFLTMSLAYTLSAVTLARAGAIVQHTHAVESLSYVDVLCLDKTGTLTTNALQLHAVRPLGQLAEVDVQRLLGDFARSVSATNATTAAISQGVAGRQRVPVDEVSFASARKWSALALDDRDGRGVFVLGALEMLQPYLAADAVVAPLLQQSQVWSDQGLRVLLFAYSPDGTTLHDAAGAPTLPPLQPLGLISLRDELRPYARELLSQFTQLGIRIKIISGDNPHTVAALAKQLGLVEPKLVAGTDLATMNAAAFAQAAAEATVFGRISPDQKAQLVDALVKGGQYVAMIGDGVNDILALKKANLGIAMQNGSTATRNVADMVLLNDSYAALAPALAESKRVINGLTNAAYLLLARSLTYAFVIMGVLMVGLDFPFEPAQTGVTALTVGLPAFFLTLWARPHIRSEALLVSLVRFVLPVALWSMLIGVMIFAFISFRLGNQLQNASMPPAAIARFEQYTGLTYQVDQQFGLTASRIVAQTALSIFLSLCALILIVFLEPPVAWLASWRAVSPDRRPAWLAIGLMLLLLVGVFVPPVASYLGFIQPLPGIWGLITGGLVVWGLGLWLLWRKRWMDRLLGLDA